MSKPAIRQRPSSRAEGNTEIRVAELVDNMTGVIASVTDSSDAAADAREILSFLMDVPRSWPARHQDDTVPREIASRAMIAAEKRSHGAPIQYCAGLAAFRNLMLHVDRRVLIPRPETEQLVEHVLSRVSTGTAFDICTGSGAIALALATEGKFSEIVATDLSPDALELAKLNAHRYRKESNPAVEFLQGSGITPVISRRANVIVSNPPYIAFSELFTLDESVRDWEPSVALLAGDNGMAVIAEIISGSPEILCAGGLLALEVDSRRAGLAAELATSNGGYRDISVLSDLTGRDRFMLAYKA